jgi:hypothetical protein
VVEIQVKHNWGKWDPATQRVYFQNTGLDLDPESNTDQYGCVTYPENAEWVDYSEFCPAGFSAISVEGGWDSNSQSLFELNISSSVLCLEDL